MQQSRWAWWAWWAAISWGLTTELGGRWGKNGLGGCPDKVEKGGSLVSTTVRESSSLIEDMFYHRHDDHALTIVLLAKQA